MYINEKKALTLVASILDLFYDGSAPTRVQFNEVLRELGVTSPEDMKSSFWGRAIVEEIEREYCKVRFLNGQWYCVGYDEQGNKVSPKYFPTNSRYTGGNSGWGTMGTYCSDCGALIAEYAVDKDGVPTDLLWTEEDVHGYECPVE